MTNSALDLERDLRAMLRTRARDVDFAPERLTKLTDELADGVIDGSTGDKVDTDDPRRARGEPIELVEAGEPSDLDVARARRRPVWLFAAAAAIVVAAVSVAVAVSRPDAHDRRSPATHTNAPGPTSLRSAVKLSWFGLDVPSGYTLVERDSDPGSRTAYLAQRGDTGAQRGGPRDDPSVSITVFDANVYNPVKAGLVNGKPTTFAKSSPGYLGATTTRLRDGGNVRVRTDGWEYAANSWAVVQWLKVGLHDDHDLGEVLARGLDATHQDPITVPFRLSAVPAGTITSVTDARPDRPLTIEFTDDATKTDFVVAPGTLSHEVLAGDRTRRVGGRTGYVDATGNAKIPIEGGSLQVSATTEHGSHAGAVDAVLDTVRFSGADGAPMSLDHLAR